MNNIQDPINKYFASKNIKVSYNTIGATVELVNAYVSQFHSKVDAVKGQKSHFIKTDCYNEIFELPTRQKFTGFEKFKKLDTEFRKTISPFIIQSQYSETMIVENEALDNQKNYRNVLINHVKTIDKPILYLSGGIDSELVATTMIKSGVNFLPVIFNLKNNQGQVLNIFEIQYAYDFCNKNNLLPVVEEINIENLWNNSEFKKLAIDMQIVSPHLVTHAYMIFLMNKKYPDSTHVFGGEVRFYTHHELDDGRMASLVLLNKVQPAFNGNISNWGWYTTTTPPTEVYMYQTDLYYNNDGTWQQTSAASSTPGAYYVTSPYTSGNWYDNSSNPGRQMQWRISAVTLNSTGGRIGPGSLSPALAPWYYYSPTTSTGWATINTNGTGINYNPFSLQIGFPTSATSDYYGEVDVSVTIEVRSVNYPTYPSVMTTNYRIVAEIEWPAPP